MLGRGRAPSFLPGGFAAPSGASTCEAGRVAGAARVRLTAHSSSRSFNTTRRGRVEGTTTAISVPTGPTNIAARARVELVVATTVDRLEVLTFAEFRRPPRLRPDRPS